MAPQRSKVIASAREWQAQRASVPNTNGKVRINRAGSKNPLREDSSMDLAVAVVACEKDIMRMLRPVKTKPQK